MSSKDELAAGAAVAASGSAGAESAAERAAGDAAHQADAAAIRSATDDFVSAHMAEAVQAVACKAASAAHDMVDLEYERLVAEAGLPAEALPSTDFFTANVDGELARAAAPAPDLGEGAVGAHTEEPLDNNAVQAARAADAREPLAIGVLLSGSGTNLQALIDAIDAGVLNAQIKLVVASHPSAYGLKRAEAAGIQTLTLSKEMYADPIQADEIIAHELLACGCQYVVMAGYMRKVHAPLLATFPNRVVNIHPALLPSFQGAHGIQDAFDRGVKVTGVTVHFANAAYDMGPIIAQRALAVEEGWDVETLEEHIHAIEHVLYPEVVQLLADGRVYVREDLTVEVRP